MNRTAPVTRNGREVPGPMKILAIDTSTPRGSIALLQGMEISAEFHLHSLETHSARLLASIEFLLKMAGWELSELGLVVAGIGPGSFTGIRIGVSTALGLAQTCGINFAGISCLDALAQKLAGSEGSIGAVMDAQRGQIYYAEYAGRRGRVIKAGKPLLLKPEELGERLRGRHQHLIGDGALRYRDLLLRPGVRPRLLEVDLFLAGAMGRLALTRKRCWRAGAYLLSEPLYIRPPDAFKGKGKTK
jgi:tRNA threonylcarbamoyladenosine biosynthesis protein TsaB